MVQMLAGFQISQALMAVAELDIATVLVGGPLTVGEVAGRTGTDASAVLRLVRSLEPLGIFVLGEGDLVTVTPLGATLARGTDHSVRDAALYWQHTHYAPFGEFSHSVRTGEAGTVKFLGKPFFEWVAEDPALVELQNNCFATVTDTLKIGMFEGYRLPAGAVVADIGGADGAMLAQLLADEPDRKGIVFDLPGVVADVPQLLAAQGLSARIQAVGGDFFDEVPAADVYVLSHVVHDWDDDSAARILKNIARAARPGARLVVIESVIPATGEPHFSKMLDLIMLGLYPGRERTESEYRALLATAGFTLDRVVPSPTPYSFIEATLD
jgi:SAM-dependent methyltransferase